MSEHTKVPWQYGMRVKTIGRIMTHAITDKDEMPIAQFWIEEDALMAVKACNVHEELVEALNTCIESMKRNDELGWSDYAIKIAKNALSKVGTSPECDIEQARRLI